MNDQLAFLRSALDTRNPATLWRFDRLATRAMFYDADLLLISAEFERFDKELGAAIEIGAPGDKLTEFYEDRTHYLVNRLVKATES